MYLTHQRRSAAPLGSYAALNGNSVPKLRDNLSVHFQGSRTSVRNYQSKQRNNTEERRSHLHRDGSLKSHI